MCRETGRFGCRRDRFLGAQRAPAQTVRALHCWCAPAPEGAGPTPWTMRGSLGPKSRALDAAQRQRTPLVQVLMRPRPQLLATQGRLRLAVKSATPSPMRGTMLDRPLRQPGGRARTAERGQRTARGVASWLRTCGRSAALACQSAPKRKRAGAGRTRAPPRPLSPPCRLFQSSPCGSGVCRLAPQLSRCGRGQRGARASP